VFATGNRLGDRRTTAARICGLYCCESLLHSSGEPRHQPIHGCGDRGSRARRVSAAGTEKNRCCIAPPGSEGVQAGARARLQEVGAGGAATRAEEAQVLLHAKTGPHRGGDLRKQASL
jgi:hypothetical protein